MGTKLSVTYKGKRYWLNGGYYCDRRGRMLHRAIYRDEYGPIPEGLDVHHKDFVKTNNEATNLEALTRAEHLRRHRAGGRFGSREHLAKRERERWESREPHLVACSHCGKEYSSTGTRAAFCSGACKQAARRLLYPLEALKWRDPPKRQPRQPRFCKDCGIEFQTADPRTVCCSRQCGNRYRLKAGKAAAADGCVQHFS